MINLNKKLIYGTGSAALIACAVAVIILLNVLAGILADRFGWQIDVTETKLLDFSDEFIEIIKSVDKQVDAYFLVDPAEIESKVQTSNYWVMAKQILEKMNSINNNINVYVMDPDSNPELLSKFGSVNQADIIFSCGENYSSMPSSEICSYDSNGNQAIAAENKFSSMLASVTREEKIKVGLVTGHDEMDTSAIKGVFDDEGIEYEDFNILIDGVSDDYDMIFIYGPQIDFTADEISAIENYLSSGHNMQIYFDKAAECPNITEYMAQLGLKYNIGYVEEKDSAHLISGYAVPEIYPHTITNKISNKLVIPYTVSITALWESKNSIDTAYLLRTSENAALYTNQQAKGYYYLMAISSRVTDSSVISNVIAGCSSYIYNEGVIDYNKPLLLNSVLWMGKADSDIYIAPKPINNSALEITSEQYRVWQVVYVIVIPFFILVAGLFVWYKRRYL